MRTRTATIALALTAVIAASPPPAPAASATPDYVPGELLVGYGSGRERVLELPPEIGVTEAAGALRANPGVAYATPNYIARAATIPNDTGLFGALGDWQRTQWNFLPCGSLCGQSAAPAAVLARGGINAPAAWSVLEQRGAAGARGAVVAVLDTGVAFRTRKPGFLKSPDFSARQFLRGFDFVSGGGSQKKGKERPIGPGLPLDRDGHGTHVAGTIGERTGNRFGLTGLAYQAKLMPVRVLDAQGLGTARDISRGIRFAAKNDADVINMSFEFALSVNSCSKIKSVCRAVRFANKQGALVVAAAGNSNGEPVAYPGGAPGVVAVGRTTKDACLATESRTGAGLDLVAPGGGLPLSPACGANDPNFDRGVPIFQLTFAGSNFRTFGYPASYEGTSMAAAHVSGVAAMVIASRVLGANPAPAAVECQLRGTARNQPTQLGETYDPRLFGAGLVDAAAAVSARAAGC